MPGPGTRASRPRPARVLGDAWIWKDVLKANIIRHIDRTAIELSDTPVSSASGSELVCSYNWRNGQDTKLHIPGFAAIWQEIPLPVTLREDKGVYFVDQNGARVPKFPFEPLFRATSSMDPTFRFDDVDVLSNRNSLRKLLEFSAGRRQDSFRLNLHMVHRTLVIERCEKNARQKISGSLNPGWGKTFERRFTKFPSGLEDSISHHRSLRYRLGELDCVVQFEVDACYDNKSEVTDGTESLAPLMNNLKINNGPEDEPDIVKPLGQEPPMVQEMAAEIKTASKLKSLGKNLPQLWFGRTPWLIVGRHTQGTFEELRVTNAEANFVDWESRNQANLRTLVAVLGKLREAVKDNGGKHCVALCEKNTLPPAIRVFPSTVAKKAVPDDLRGKLWNSEAGRPSTNARR
ncbi:hypothetical protein PG999_014123 [Apiospora kogelbergensis]|uniref:Geranylgeranyl pyrophosphate synthetase n=1 Tax=Apiospora kogelbergensis TaxID=1337665 RepID=A0AAW0Q801_9PEZI